MFYTCSVKFWVKSKHQRGTAKCAAAGLMFGLWVLTLLLTASPELHKLLHSDAQNLNHHCLVTQIKEHSIVSAASTLVAVMAPQELFATAPANKPLLVSTRQHRLSDSRAPPLYSYSATVAG